MTTIKVFRHVNYQPKSAWAKFYYHWYKTLKQNNNRRNTGYLTVEELNALLVDYNATATIPKRFSNSFYDINFESDGDLMIFTMKWA